MNKYSVVHERRTQSITLTRRRYLLTHGALCAFAFIPAIAIFSWLLPDPVQSLVRHINAQPSYADVQFRQALAVLKVECRRHVDDGNGLLLKLRAIDDDNLSNLNHWYLSTLLQMEAPTVCASLKDHQITEGNYNNVLTQEDPK